MIYFTEKQDKLEVSSVDPFLLDPLCYQELDQWSWKDLRKAVYFTVLPRTVDGEPLH